MIKLVNKMNEWKPHLAVSGWPKEEWTVIGHKASSDSPTSYKCQSGKQEWKNVRTDVWKLGEKRWHSRLSSDLDTMRPVRVWWPSNWRKRRHTKTHVHAEWNPREPAGSDHNPLPPAPHSGKDITAAQMGRPIKTQNHHSHPHTLFLRLHLPPCFFLLLFSSALSPSLSVAFLSIFFFKLVYRTRREAACGKELSLLSFDDVNSVVVPQRTFFLWREKKPAVSSLFSFCSLFVSQSFSCFL